MKKISGAIGYTILYNDKLKKNVLLFADIHDGVNYCENIQENIDIDDYFRSLIKNNNTSLILEESVYDPSLNLVDLWPNAGHTQDLKIILNKYPKNIIPTDIRPLLIPFSWQLLNSNTKYENIKLHQYLILIDLFFKQKGLVFKKYIIPLLYFIPKDKIKILFIQFKEIQKQYQRIINKWLDCPLIKIHTMENKIGIKYLDEIDNINSLIMEWYILLLIFSDNKLSIIHTGLAHSSNLLKFLQEMYDFEIIKKHGINYLEDIKWDDLPRACILNPDI
jgi:hypothetical protein